MFSLRKSVPVAAAGILGFFAAGCLPALAQSYADASSFPGFDKVVSVLGYGALHGDQRDLAAFMLILFTLGFGYFSHLAFRSAGFGVLLNGLIGLAGTCCALLLLGPEYHLLASFKGRAHDFLLAVLVAGAAVPTLLLAIRLANLRRRATTEFFYARSRRKIEAARAARIQPELPPRIAEIARK
jgi:hypothetical protein